MSYSAVNFTLNDNYGICPFRQSNDHQYNDCTGPDCPVSVATGNDRYCAFAVIPGILDALRNDIKRIGGGF